MHLLGFERFKEGNWYINSYKLSTGRKRIKMFQQLDFDGKNVTQWNCRYLLKSFKIATLWFSMLHQNYLDISVSMVIEFMADLLVVYG